MRNILAAAHLRTLADFAFSNVLVAFDYDGTLAPLAADPRRVRMRARTCRLLEVVAQCYPCIVLSERPLADLESRFEHIPVWSVFGDLARAPAIGGTRAVKSIPRGRPDKGVILQRARRVLACDTAIYVGDDETDEDVFASARADRVLGIRIGRAGASRARYGLRTQRDVDRLLERLLAFRAPRHVAAKPCGIAL